MAQRFAAVVGPSKAPTMLARGMQAAGRPSALTATAGSQAFLAPILTLRVGRAFAKPARISGQNSLAGIAIRLLSVSNQAEQPEKEPETAEVYVGGLGPQVTPRVLRELLEEVGGISKVFIPAETRMMGDKLVKLWKPFAFVEYESLEAAAKAVEHFQGRMLLGRELRLNLQKKRTEVPKSDHTNRDTMHTSNRPTREQDSENSLYCRGFSTDIDKARLHEFFGSFGIVRKIYLPEEPTVTQDGHRRMRNRGYAFITYENPEDAKEVLSRTEAHILDGYRLTVRSRVPNSTAGRTLSVDTAGDDVKGHMSAGAAVGFDTPSTTADDAPKSSGEGAPAHKETEPERSQESSSAVPADSVTEAIGETGPVSQPEGETVPESSSSDARVGDDTASANPTVALAKEKVAPVAQPKRSAKQVKKLKKEDAKRIQLQERTSVKDLSELMGVRVVDILKTIIRMGEEPKTIMHELDAEISELVVIEHGMEPQLPDGAISVQLGRQFSPEEYAELPPRAPIVTIMGHVDHGKTTLLDYLRSSSVAEGEAGGITQSIAAFEVHRPELGRICFIDTPGHAAFGNMRERGARVTDIVVLVIAATEGVMPQTIEVIQRAHAAEVPLIVAVNKCDMPGADPDMVLQQLTEHGVIVEALGGDVQHVNIAARHGDGVEQLEESISVLAEMMELKAPSDGPAEGFVVESRKDKGLGPIANVIVTMGTLTKGDFVVAGTEHGRVRVLKTAYGEMADSAGPSSVAEVVGFKTQPSPGDEMFVVGSEKDAIAYTEKKQLMADAAPTRAKFTKVMHNEDGFKEVPIVLKADVDGALEAIVGSLMALPRTEIGFKIVATGVGPVTESDVLMAQAAEASVYSFNLKSPGAPVLKLLRQHKIELIEHNVIYHLLEQATETLISFLPPIEEVTELGLAEVLQVFDMKKSIVAGCKVREGVCNSSSFIQVQRDGELIFEGPVESIRRHKDTVNEVPEGSECGIILEGFTAFEAGDTLRCIKKEQITRTSL